MGDVSYRVCDRSGLAVFSSLEELDAYLTRLMDSGHTFSPIKRIAKVTSEDVPFTDVVRKYNEMTSENGDSRHA